MKKLCFKIFICIILYTVLSPEHILAQSDKRKHFWISTIFGATSETFLYYETGLKIPKSIFIGTVIGTLPGIAKELIDSSKEDNYFDNNDLSADIIGAFTGVLFSAIFRNNILMINKDDKQIKFSIFY